MEFIGGLTLDAASLRTVHISSRWQCHLLVQILRRTLSLVQFSDLSTSTSLTGAVDEAASQIFQPYGDMEGLAPTEKR